MKVLFGVVMMLGSFMGAGFVSGKEIASYFGVCGGSSIFGIILSGAILFLLLYFFMSLSCSADGFGELIDRSFGRLSHVIKYLFVVIFVLLISAMFAGSMSVASFIGLSPITCSLCTGLLAYFVVSKNVKGLSMVNLILMPILIIIILILSFTKSNSYVNFDISKTILSVVNGFNYSCLNIVSLGMFALEIGKHYNKKQIALISSITSLVVIFILLIVNNHIIIGNYIDCEMPIFAMVGNSKVFRYVAGVAIWIGIFTTLISDTLVVSDYFVSGNFSKKKSIIWCLSIGYLISFFGFDFMVNYVYVMIGFLGIIFVSVLIIKEWKSYKLFHKINN